MGQGIGRVPEAPAVGGGADGGREPIGRYIAQQRRLRGIELEDLAASTRIPRRSLERLEAGAFDHSPDGFSRGFVRTVAEAIGLDPDDAVARMLPEPDTQRRGSPRRSRALAAVAGAVAFAALALGVRELASSLPAPPRRAASSELPVRRDYVRALAEAQGIATNALTARSAVLAPLPAETPAAEGDAALALTPGVDASASGAARHATSHSTAAGPPATTSADAPAARPAASSATAAVAPAPEARVATPAAAPPAPPASTGSGSAAEPSGLPSATAAPSDPPLIGDSVADASPAPSEPAPLPDAEDHD